MPESLIEHDAIKTELATRGARFSPVSLELPDSIEEPDWMEIGRQLCRCDTALNWWLGDFLAYGERSWGKLKQFAEANNFSYDHLKWLSVVSESVKKVNRFTNLTWTHHKEVYNLPEREQRKWLKLAVEKGMSCAELRRAIRQTGLKSANDPDGPQSDWPQDKPVPQVVDWLKKQPADFWTDGRKEWWRNYLKPIAEFYQSL